MKLYALIFSLFFSFIGSAQNLVVNGGFEDENICTEYHEPCAPEGWFGNTGGFKNYIVDESSAHDGSHYLAIEAGRTRNKYQRSYTRTQLLCNLRSGNKYRLQFYLKAPTNILDSIGVYFTPTDFLFNKNLLHNIEPTAFVINENKPEPNNRGWQQFNFIYTAKGDEKYITIANFSKRDINGETGLAGESHFFVYLDGVSLTPVNPDEQLCGDALAAKTVVYEINDRHEYFERYVRFYRSQNKVADPPKLSLTRIQKTHKLILKDEQFITGRSNLRPEGYATLDNFFDNLTNQSFDNAEIIPYPDSIGDAIGTDELSLQRTALLKEYIRRKLKTEEKNIQVIGSQQPSSNTKTTSASTKPGKRRVELMVYFHD